MRQVHSGDVQFLPRRSDGTARARRPELRETRTQQSQRLFDDLVGDNLQDYLTKYPDADLSGHKSIE